MKPAAGVTATRPTTMPVAAPIAVAFFVRIRSSSVQTTSVAVGASIVFANASAALADPAAAPHPMRNRRVDEQRPERDERDVGTEAHPLDDRAGDQRRGDDGEGPLIREEQEVRDRPLRAEADAAEEEEPAAAAPRRPMSEGDGVAEERPGQADEAERGEAHHQRVEGILRAHHPTVEESEGGGHHEDERGGNQEPGSVGAVDGGQPEPPWFLRG